MGGPHTARRDADGQSGYAIDQLAVNGCSPTKGQHVQTILKRSTRHIQSTSKRYGVPPRCIPDLWTFSGVVCQQAAASAVNEGYIVTPFKVTLPCTSCHAAESSLAFAGAVEPVLENSARLSHH